MKRKEYPTFEWIDSQNSSINEVQEVPYFSDIGLNLLADSFEPGHLPKIEQVADYTFIILRAYSVSDNTAITTIDEISNKIAFFINDKKLLTIHRVPFEFLNYVGKKATNSEALMLEIINKMLLSYELPIQLQGEKMDTFERGIFLDYGSNLSIESLYFQKTEARLSKKILLLTQNVLKELKVKPENNSNLQDLKDTTVKLILLCDEVVEDSTTLLNSYLSITAQKNNDVMKLLTVFSAFFLPLTFIAGVYGMNFKNMPEVETENGYYVTLAVMLLLSIGIYMYFKKKNIL